MSGFKISRVIHYRNSFLPIVVGKMLPRLQGGTHIDVEMRMQWLVTAFMIVWAGFPLSFVAAALLHINIGIWHSRARQGAESQLFAAAVAMVAFGYVLCAVAFNIEAKRAQVLLLNILDAR